jgi:hypothetical protein
LALQSTTAAAAAAAGSGRSRRTVTFAEQEDVRLPDGNQPTELGPAENNSSSSRAPGKCIRTFLLAFLSLSKQGGSVFPADSSTSSTSRFTVSIKCSPHAPAPLMHQLPSCTRQQHYAYP